MQLYNNPELNEIKAKLNELRIGYRQFMLNYKLETDKYQVRMREIFIEEAKRRKERPEKPGRKAAK